MFKLGLFIFGRDLRWEDHRGLADIFNQCQKVVPLFILDPEILAQINALETPKLTYILAALKHLDQQAPVYVKRGPFLPVFTQVLHELKPQKVYLSAPLSWSGVSRLSTIQRECASRNIDLQVIAENRLLSRDPHIPYKVYSHYASFALKNLDLKPALLPGDWRDRILPLSWMRASNLSHDLPWKQPPLDPTQYILPSELPRYLNLLKLDDYHLNRNKAYDPSSTSRLSPAIRLGLVSIRQLASKALKQNQTFLKELIWREFWYHIGKTWPETQTQAFQAHRRNIPWQHNEKFMKAIEQAETGYPLIDASIRALKTHYFLHNRWRMVLASFMTKVLGLDWRWGEAFMARYLVDHDEMVNVGNWQWCAGIGADPRPFRLFNPIRQAKAHDPDGTFIKTFIPELRSLSCEILHDPLNHKIPGYPPPIVDYYQQVATIRQWFQPSKS